MNVETKRGSFEVIGRGQGTPVVLLHGFPFAAESWRADAEALAPRMRVVAPSMRGFGASDTSRLDALSIDTMAEDVEAVLDALGIAEPVVLGGLSMGGYVALAFARRAPGRLRALVLADTRAEPDSDEARANRDKAIARVERGDLAGFVGDLVPGLVSPVTRAERLDVVEELRRMAMSAAPASVIAALRALRDRPDARPGLAAIAVPALVVVGEDDTLTPPAVARSMAAAIGGGGTPVRVIPRAGHMSNLEQPDAFREALTQLVVNAPERRPT
ncbi:MAG: alpha/beta hydrolase fold protein [Labilithrix sp.]|jgi:pimeloyl-ACP methyl ester carboxylesterase|nr:alpha/beta hydrolase fold protein [Labilithrix sp.]